MKILLVLLFIIIIICAFSPNREKFAISKDDIPNGICDCCECGWISCDECETNRQKCCGNSLAFDRYTFS
jgi:hypothetical protein